MTHELVFFEETTLCYFKYATFCTLLSVFVLLFIQNRIQYLKVKNVKEPGQLNCFKTKKKRRRHKHNVKGRKMKIIYNFANGVRFQSPDGYDSRLPILL